MKGKPVRCADCGSLWSLGRLDRCPRCASANWRSIRPGAKVPPGFDPDIPFEPMEKKTRSLQDGELYPHTERRAA